MYDREKQQIVTFMNLKQSNVSEKCDKWLIDWSKYLQI